MPEEISEKPNLGICFNGNQIFYAISDPQNPKSLLRIGSAEFNNEVSLSLEKGNEAFFSTVEALIKKLKKQYSPELVRLLTTPTHELWTILPKSVYRDRNELESYISILKPELNRSDVEVSWLDLSNQEHQMLCLRDKNLTNQYLRLAGHTHGAELISDMHLGSFWNQHAKVNGSYLTVSCYKGAIAIASYLLGKLRAATYIRYNTIKNIPYYWQDAAQHLSWMNGYHEQIYVYGYKCQQTVEYLQPLWDSSAEVVRMNSLEHIGVEANERTYGFNLDQAFPAIILALDA